MIQGKRVLALIPARGGSKGIKDKNIRPVADKPLIAYSIEAGKNCEYVDDVVITTDSGRIKAVAEEYGAWVPFLRPDELASDTATTLDAVLHAVNTLKEMGKEYDILVILQPTSPLRDGEDLKGALEKYITSGERSMASVSVVEDHPLLIRTLQDDTHMKKMLDVSSTCRRQDMPEFYRINGAIYINSISELNDDTSFNDNEVPYIISEEHAVDIDEYKDLILAEWYLCGKPI
ncbi:CMP-N,N'-diacetyllegionaminic acid synthase [Pseudobutyrivibrio sp. YE44]|uniref:acylneuraminate cytidylyltransferase family protein n=1 Tax=Pseudobutyrivibrio sp. YE44 TaxID=1520802 RepID=UPI0008873161|nr:acylneuraminate cytidylyltransferase family protein [Pseudobutyrivibrio sp. YE44]SDB39106.1 CMP-N,N'-diacetyllegionaminic acid synthase [Pseudobutyrivibrio sp. YE44]